MRLPFLRPKTPAKAEPARTVAAEPGAVEAARTQARRRLVGAVVLLLIGVVGFPVLFETQPRPLPLDTPFVLPHREGPAPAATPPQRPLPVTPLPADAGVEPAAPASTVAGRPEVAPIAASSAPPAIATAVASAPVATPPASRAQGLVAVASAPAAPAAPRPAHADDGARARALLEGSTAAAVPAATASAAGRFVVQVGAYSDPNKLHDARAKVERLGLKTYTQVVENDAGKRTRVRVGPYATRAEAEAVATKVKRNGLPANILAL